MPEQPVPSQSGSRSGRLPPYSEEAEKGVLGSILQEQAIYDLCREKGLTAESFHVPANRIVFETMGEMAEKGEAIDVVLLADRLRSGGKLERAGGEVGLHRLIDSTPTTAHAGFYIETVLQKHIFRRIIETARDAESECYDTEEDAFGLLGRIEQNFFSITDARRNSIAPWREMVEGVVEQIEHIGEEGDTGLKTGFLELDRNMGSMRPGNMMILAARPSMGKTSLAMNIVDKVARGHGTGVPPAAVGMFSLEMSRDDLVMRMLCTEARVSMAKVREGYLASRSDEHRRLIEAADVLSKARIFLDDSAGLDVLELKARARRMRQKHDVRLIVVDYLQLLHHKDAARQGRQLETAAISGALKGMAKELGIPVIVLSQLSRAPDAREEGRPRLSDLRDSGSLEQDADVVLLLRRPCRIKAGSERDLSEDEKRDRQDARLAIIDLAKNRNGPTRDDIKMNFEEEFTRFDDRAENYGADGAGEQETEYIEEGMQQ